MRHREQRSFRPYRKVGTLLSLAIALTTITTVNGCTVVPHGYHSPSSVPTSTSAPGKVGSPGWESARKEYLHKLFSGQYPYTVASYFRKYPTEAPQTIVNSSVVFQIRGSGSGSYKLSGIKAGSNITIFLTCNSAVKWRWELTGPKPHLGFGAGEACNGPDISSVGYPIKTGAVPTGIKVSVPSHVSYSVIGYGS